MIISRTPFRTSFVGGGTDLESFCLHEPGAVLSATINKFIYVTVKRQVSIASHTFRVSWNKLEFTNTVDEIEHPIVREALKLLKINYPIEITTFADIPSHTGLGSSSAFAVGLLHALLALQGKRATKGELANMAAEIEIRTLGRPIGTQDHYAASYGGFNVLRFYPDLKTEVSPVFYRNSRIRDLESRLLLVYTEMQRDSWRILKGQSEDAKKKFETLQKMRDLVKPLELVMHGDGDLNEFGELLHENWLLKRSLTQDITNGRIDEFYQRARKAGAVGGKLLGAGGGGFLLLYAPPDRIPLVRAALHDLYCMPFRFEFGGTRITYYDQSNVEESDINHPVMVDYKNQ